MKNLLYKTFSILILIAIFWPSGINVHASTDNNLPAFGGDNTVTYQRCDSRGQKECAPPFYVALSSSEYQAYKASITVHVDHWEDVDDGHLKIEMGLITGSPSTGGSGPPWQTLIDQDILPPSFTGYRDPGFSGNCPWNGKDDYIESSDCVITRSFEIDLGNLSPTYWASFHITVNSIYTHSDISIFGRRVHIGEPSVDPIGKEVSWSGENFSGNNIANSDLRDSSGNVLGRGGSATVPGSGMYYIHGFGAGGDGPPTEVIKPVNVDVSVPSNPQHLECVNNSCKLKDNTPGNSANLGGCTAAGQSCGVINLPPPTGNPYCASFVSQSVTSPVSVQAGQSYGVSVTMHNCGTKTWTPQENFRLGSQNPQDNSTWGTGRVDVNGPVAPNQNQTFNFNVTAPSVNGTYNFQWRMLQELVQWFGDYTPNVVVEVSVVPPQQHFECVNNSCKLKDNTPGNSTSFRGCTTVNQGCDGVNPTSLYTCSGTSCVESPSGTYPAGCGGVCNLQTGTVCVNSDTNDTYSVIGPDQTWSWSWNGLRCFSGHIVGPYRVSAPGGSVRPSDSVVLHKDEIITFNVTFTKPPTNLTGSITCNGQRSSCNISPGNAANFVWNSSGATQCHVLPYPSSPPWMGANGSATDPAPATRRVDLDCWDSKNDVVVDSVNVTVGTVKPPTPPPPTGGGNPSITCNPQSVPYQTSANISWSSTGFSSCSVSPAGWSGTTGNQPTGNLTSDTTYTVTCKP